MAGPGVEGGPPRLAPTGAGVGAAPPRSARRGACARSRAAPRAGAAHPRALRDEACPSPPRPRSPPRRPAPPSMRRARSTFPACLMRVREERGAKAADRDRIARLGARGPALPPSGRRGRSGARGASQCPRGPERGLPQPVGRGSTRAPSRRASRTPRSAWRRPPLALPKAACWHRAAEARARVRERRPDRGRKRRRDDRGGFPSSRRLARPERRRPAEPRRRPRRRRGRRLPVSGRRAGGPVARSVRPRVGEGRPPAAAPTPGAGGQPLGAPGPGPAPPRRPLGPTAGPRPAWSTAPSRASRGARRGRR